MMFYSTMQSIGNGSNRVLSLVVVIFTAMCLLLPPNVICAVTGPVYLEKYVGDDARFTWSTTDNRRYLFVVFGISDSDSNDIPSNKVLFSGRFSRQPQVSSPRNTTDPLYKGRLFFYGDLRAGRAMFEIRNITVADENVYMMKIAELARMQMMIIKGTLKVRVAPAFTSQLSSQHDIAENTDLSIVCSARGRPAPNVTWVWKTDGSQVGYGIGSATLSIPRITRDKKGVYECQAINDPSRTPITSQTTVNVQYKPEVRSKVSSWNGNEMNLQCQASGVPSPQITWYMPSGQPITAGVTAISGGSQLRKQTTQDGGDYGQYKCRGSNLMGFTDHLINVTQLLPPGPPVVTVTDIEASSITVRWRSSVSDGGSAVIDYNVEVSTKSTRERITGNSVVISDLTKNKEYVVRVSARNKVGYGSAGTTTIRTKKQGPPSLPIIEASSKVTTDLQVLLKWNKPDENGGTIQKYAIYYKITYSNGDATEWQKRHTITDTTVLQYTVEGLKAGRTYSFLVIATSQYGESTKDYSKARVVQITTKPITSGPTKDSLKKESRCSCSNSTIIAVSTSFIAVLAVANVLQFIYIWRYGTFASRRDKHIRLVRRDYFTSTNTGTFGPTAIVT